MRSLRRQLTWRMLVAFALLLGAGGALVYWAVHHSVHAQFDEALRVKAMIVITATEQTNGRVDVDFSDRYLREFDDDIATDFFQVFDDEGKSLDRSDSLKRENLPLIHGTLEEPEYRNLPLPNGHPGRAIGIRFQPRTQGGSQRNRNPVHAIVVVAEDRRELDAVVRELRGILAASGLMLLALTAVIVPLALRRGLRPLDQIADATARIDASSLDNRFAVDAMPAELQPVGRRLNDLLARLEASFERERRFSADIAHELRTPLAELRSQAELALKWPEERTPATDRVILDIAMQMEALVASLLALGRAEKGRTPLEKKPIEIAPLVDELLRPLWSRIETAGLRIEREIPADARVETDPVLFRAIAANLIENAVIYSAPNGSVRIAFARDEAGFRFEVINPAPNLQRDDLSRMFDRFWRKDAARTGGDHSGLGLALARSFATLLELELAPELREDGVLKMTLRGAG